MAFSAGAGNIEMVDGRFRKTGRENPVSGTVGGMTIVAGGGEIYTSQRSLAVDAVFEHLHRVFHQYIILLHQVEIFMTFPAGARQVQGIGFGLLVFRMQDIVRSVAIGAAGSVGAIGSFKMTVPLILFLLLGMAITAIHPGQFLIVRNLRNPLMAGSESMSQ